MTYIEEIADAIRRRVDHGAADDPEATRLYLVYAVLALTVGENVTRRHVHDAWSAWKAMSDPGHESIRPFEELEADIQQDDQPFVSAIKDVARQLKAIEDA